MQADEERVKLEALAEMLALESDDASQEYLMQVTIGSPGVPEQATWSPGLVSTRVNHEK